MNKIYDYTSLSLTELIEKISTARFFHLPKMVAEAFRKVLQYDSRPYKVYTALLSQSGTDAPTAVVLENTLGDIVWSRSEEGVYVGTLTGAFKEGKTFLISKFKTNSTDDPSSYSISDAGVNAVYVTSESSDVLQDGILYSTPIEIKVYN